MGRSTPVDIELDAIERETDKAMLVRQGDTQAWVPMSMVDKITRKPNGTAEIRIPDWLADEKGLE